MRTKISRSPYVAVQAIAEDPDRVARVSEGDVPLPGFGTTLGINVRSAVRFERHASLEELEAAIASGGLGDVEALTIQGDVDVLPSNLGELSNVRAVFLNAKLSTGKKRKTPFDLGSLWQLAGLKYLRLFLHDETELAEGIGKLAALEVLHITGSKLVKLPPDLGKCTALETLELEECKKLVELPDLSGLTSLKALRFFNAGCKEIPGLSQMKALERVDMQMTKLKTIDGIEKLPRLHEVMIEDSKIAQLPSGLGRLEALSSLQIERCPLRKLPPDLGDLAKIGALSLEVTEAAYAKIPEAIKTALGPRLYA